MNLGRRAMAVGAAVLVALGMGLVGMGTANAAPAAMIAKNPSQCGEISGPILSFGPLTDIFVARAGFTKAKEAVAYAFVEYITITNDGSTARIVRSQTGVVPGLSSVVKTYVGKIPPAGKSTIRVTLGGTFTLADKTICLMQATQSGTSTSTTPSSNPPGTFVAINGQNGSCLDADLNTIGSNGTKVQLYGCNNTAQQNWISSSKQWTIKSSRSGQCLDADLNTIGPNGSKVQLSSCNGQLQQQWLISPGSAAGTHVIVSRYNGKCLDADLNTIAQNGTRIQLWDCNGQAQQNWRTLYF